MTRYSITTSDVIPGVEHRCLIDMLWQSYYRGWESAGRGRPCKPGELLKEPQKRAYREGYYARCKLEGNISAFVEWLGNLKEREIRNGRDE